MAIEQPDRDVCVIIHLDTNRINSRQRLPEINQLEKWHEDGVITLEISEVAQLEAMEGSDQIRTRKAVQYIFTETRLETPHEKETLKAIAKALFPGGPTSRNDQKDIEIVFNAMKYGAILVTADGASKSQPGGILGGRDELAMLGVRVCTGAEAVAHVRREIAVRDQQASAITERYKLPLPEWVGKD